MEAAFFENEYHIELNQQAVIAAEMIREQGGVEAENFFVMIVFTSNTVIVFSLLYVASVMPS